LGTLRERRLKLEWDLLGLAGVEDLPAVKWKLMNIKRMEKKKHKKALEKLRNYLDSIGFITFCVFQGSFSYGNHVILNVFFHHEYIRSSLGLTSFYNLPLNHLRNRYVIVA